MKQSYLRRFFFVVVILCCLPNLSAQITLHDATNITQTKATLSADFPDLNTEHGFMYKYGIIPEIDEFSQVALSSSSDPINLTSNNWHSMKSKGYVETYSGQSGSIIAKVVLYQPSTISFDWSIDAQEGCAFLRYSKDSGLGSNSFGGGSTSISYYEISRITGNTPFTTYTTSVLPIGTHYLEWEYCQVSPSSVGLDVARIKNIKIQNTLPGEWNILNVTGSSVELSSLVPNSGVIYRGYTKSLGETTMSFVKSFQTSNIEIGSVQIEDITQTTAKIERKVGFSDANLLKGVNFMLINPQVASLVKKNFDCTGLSISAPGWEVKEQGLQYSVEAGHSNGSLTLDFKIFGEKYTNYKVEFDVDNESTYFSGCYCGLFVDGAKNVKETFDKGKSHYVLELKPGTHSLQWKAQRWNSSAAGGTITISNLSIENIVSGIDFQTNNTNDDFTLLTSLSPNSTYNVQSFVIPSNSSEFPQAWQGECSEWSWIHTKAIEVTAYCDDVTQTSFTINGNINRGDASTYGIGFQYKIATGDSWIDVPLNNDITEFSQNVGRLKPASIYEVRAYAIYENGEYTYSNIVSLTTAPVIPLKPIIKYLSQHQATIEGEIIFGDASIYQRGMQFRKKGADEWTEVGDDNEESVYTLICKNLESGCTYEVRTYVQPVGSDIIYSEIEEFTTLDTYFVSCNSNKRTQTSITLEAILSDVDDNILIEHYGFEYYISSDGFFESADLFVKSDVFDILVSPNGKELKTVITGLTPSIGIRWRAYAQINGIKTYYTSNKDLEWDYAVTDRATISAAIKNITQTSISLELDATQEGDAVISQIEYALANSVQDTQPYSLCGNVLTLNNLVPNKQYNIRFRGLVNERYCPLLKDISWDYSWFEYKTLPVNVSVTISGITQTKAKMHISFDSEDAEISDIRYRLNYSDILQYTDNQLLDNLAPGSTHYITIYAKVNGEDISWTMDTEDNPFKFTTLPVSATISIPETYQTAAEVSWSSNVGDATFVFSGIEFSNESINSECESGEQIITGLIPNNTYLCRSYVETAEGGRVYSTQRSFTTKAISTSTLNVSNISNRSATMNGEIDCDSYSSAEFGFQWKQMEGWQSAPAFTKGVKRDDGEISVSLVNGMLEPNTDYQYRTAVRYHDGIYSSSDWETFRTESEFIYYPATVYTAFRTDRENNALILCGYYIAGSETIVSQGYEYWQVSQQSSRALAPHNFITVNTDESMQHTFLSGALANGNYAVRAFVKTEAGDILYGATLGFNVSENGYSGIDTIGSDEVNVFVENSTLQVVNGHGLSCFIYDINGILLTERNNMSDYEGFNLGINSIYIVKLSNGKVMKVRL